MIPAIHSLLILGTCGVAVLLLCAGASVAYRRWLLWTAARGQQRQYRKWDTERARRDEMWVRQMRADLRRKFGDRDR